MKIEDQSGLARGTLSDANTEARTATELTILRNRTYTTIADNQQALERALREVVRAMDKYADLYNLALLANMRCRSIGMIPSSPTPKPSCSSGSSCSTTA